jgi:hypothetical protein
MAIEQMNGQWLGSRQVDFSLITIISQAILIAFHKSVKHGLDQSERTGPQGSPKHPSPPKPATVVPGRRPSRLREGTRLWYETASFCLQRSSGHIQYLKPLFTELR